MNVRVLYFASLRDAAGCEFEQVTTSAADAQALYAQLRNRHEFALDAERIRVAVNGEFCPWQRLLAEGDEIAFLPPVSGG